MGTQTLIILLAYNEEASIAATVRELQIQPPSVDVLVVDDGSRDATAERAREAGAFVVRHPFNLGVAAGEATGLLYALHYGYTRVLRMDGDGQHDPQSIPTLLKALEEGAELVVGSRFAGVDSFQSTWVRRLGSRFIAHLLSCLSCSMRWRTETAPPSSARCCGTRGSALAAC